MEEKRCVIEGCKRPYRAKGYCNVHYKLWRRGELDAKPRYKICGEEGCRKPLHKGGFCLQHYEAWIASKKGGAASTTESAPAKPAEGNEKTDKVKVVPAEVDEKTDKDKIEP